MNFYFSDVTPRDQEHYIVSICLDVTFRWELEFQEFVRFQKVGPQTDPWMQPLVMDFVLRVFANSIVTFLS